MSQPQDDSMRALFETPAQKAEREAYELRRKEFFSSLPRASEFPYQESMLNVCKLLRDSWAIMDDLPDDSDKATAEDKLAEAIKIARQVCKDLAL